MRTALFRRDTYAARSGRCDETIIGSAASQASLYAAADGLGIKRIAPQVFEVQSSARCLQNCIAACAIRQSDAAADSGCFQTLRAYSVFQNDRAADGCKNRTSFRNTNTRRFDAAAG